MSDHFRPLMAKSKPLNTSSRDQKQDQYAKSKSKPIQKKPRRPKSFLIDPLKDKLRALDGFPNLQVNNWMPIICKHFKVKNRLAKKDPRYKQIINFLNHSKSLKAKEDQFDTRIAKMYGYYKDPATRPRPLLTPEMLPHMVKKQVEEYM